MPCFRCGARQTDPRRGPSPWKHGVAGGAYVLVCPECQRGRDWTVDLDRCAGCGSTALVKRLDEVVRRTCGAVAPALTVEEPRDAGLSAEVKAALDRMFHDIP